MMDINTESKTLPQSITVPKKIKRLGQAIQFFSTNAAVKFAYKLFTKPVKFSTPKREEMMLKSAQNERIIVDSLQKEIDVISYGYSPKKVLLVHGWSGRATQLFMVADKLLENGYMIISFNAPGHGNSDGETSNLLEFVESIKQINKEYGPFTSAVGHSLGGIALYNTANKLNLKSFVTIGAADSLSDVTHRFVKNFGFKPKVGIKLKKMMDKKFSTDIEKYSSYIKAKEINIPVLVVHDELDGDVSVSCAHNIRQNLKNGTTLITSGFSHTKILRDKETMHKVVQFIKKQ